MLEHLFLNMQIAEEQDDQEHHELIILTSLIILLAVIETRNMRAYHRRVNRHRLARIHLLPDPRVNTPWQHLLASRDDSGFITTMGFDVETFDHILAGGFRKLWNQGAILRRDVNKLGRGRPGRRSLDAEGGLGLVLHYLTSTMSETSLQEIFALVPATTSRYLVFGLKVLLYVLQHLPDTAIIWPDESEIIRFNALIRHRHPLLEGAFASIDGLNLAVQTSSNEEIENATYNGWLKAHFISSVLVFSPKGLIIAASLNAPGSWHDSRVAWPIYDKLKDGTPPGFYLVADTAFPRGTDAINGRIMAPLRAGQKLTGTQHEIEFRLALDRQLLSYRQTAEWGNRSLKGCFGQLHVPLRIHNVQHRGDLLETCVCAHCLRTRRVGLNQIQTVYEPHWGLSDRGLSDIDNMLFSELRQNDRVARYHTVAIYT